MGILMRDLKQLIKFLKVKLSEEDSDERESSPPACLPSMSHSRPCHPTAAFQAGILLGARTLVTVTFLCLVCGEEASLSSHVLSPPKFFLSLLKFSLSLSLSLFPLAGSPTLPKLSLCPRIESSSVGYKANTLPLYAITSTHK